jgi:hypothetical protein
MTYTKPEVAVLGTASSVIEVTPPNQKPIFVTHDQLGLQAPAPAYDLDE